MIDLIIEYLLIILIVLNVVYSLTMARIIVKNGLKTDYSLKELLSNDK